jgi:predicted small integral membrane protein
MAPDAAIEQALKGVALLLVALGFVLWLLVFMRGGGRRLLLLLGTTGLAGTGLVHVIAALQLFPAVR